MKTNYLEMSFQLSSVTTKSIDRFQIDLGIEVILMSTIGFTFGRIKQKYFTFRREYLSTS